MTEEHEDGHESPAGSEPQTQGGRRPLQFLEEFISKHYRRQNAFVRALTFITFVFLFAYGFLRLLGGDVVVGGTIFAPPEDSGTPYAKNFDVRVRSGRQLVGTNSQGQFNFILGRLQYLQLMGRGDLEINIANKDGYAVGDELLTYSLLSGRFEDLYLTVPPQVSARPTVGSPSNPLVVTLQAQSQSDEATGPRLFLRRIIPPAADIRNVDSSTVRLVARSADDRDSPLLTTRTPGVLAGWLPVPRSGPAVFGFDYYFALGGRATGGHRTNQAGRA